jgi:hypothetical protein
MAILNKKYMIYSNEDGISLINTHNFALLQTQTFKNFSWPQIRLMNLNDILYVEDYDLYNR